MWNKAAYQARRALLLMDLKRERETLSKFWCVCSFVRQVWGLGSFLNHSISLSTIPTILLLLFQHYSCNTPTAPLALFLPYSFCSFSAILAILLLLFQHYSCHITPDPLALFFPYSPCYLALFLPYSSCSFSTFFNDCDTHDQSFHTLLASLAIFLPYSS